MRAGLVGAMLALCALASCGPNIKDLQPGETGKVASVSDGDTLTLDSGLKVQLTGIIAPRRGFHERPDEPKAKEARQTLEKIALGRETRLAYGGEKRLGEGDAPLALAQVFVKSEGGRWIWAQQAMLREGMARARTWKDNHARYAALYAAEEIARKAKKGMWADKAYRIRNAETIKPDDSGYQIVECVVRSIGKTEKKTYLNFGDDYKTDFTVSIDATALPNWTAKDIPLDSLEHKRIRVRGFVYDSGGPLIRVDHPQAIEVLK
ncbi:MAG: thermonuclease family protein [Alphaproteobacteria bacterium]